MRICKTIIAIISALALSVSAAENSEDRPAEVIGMLEATSSMLAFCEAWSSDDREVRKKFYKDITLAELVVCLEAGANPDARRKDGFTPLHTAAANNENPAIIAALLEAGADPDARSKDGFTPLHGAAVNENPAIIAALLEAGADPDARSKDGFTPLYGAAYYNENPAIIAALLEAGANPDARSKDGFTPLHTAAYYNENPAIIAALLEAGADLGARSKDGFTPLHGAAVNENPAIIAALLEVGADLGARSKDGFTPLHSAAANNENPAIIAALLEAGADLGARSKDGFTPLELAKSMDRPTEIIGALENLRAQVPVAMQKPGSIAERIVGAIAEELNAWFGSGEPRLALSAPIHSEERDDDTVVVHFPGTEVIQSDGGHSLKLGDLVLTVTRFGETKYGFDTALPSVIESFTGSWRNGEQIFVADSAISGVWRSDLETLTALDVAASGVRVTNEQQEPFSIGWLTASSRADRSSDSLWNGKSTIYISDLRFAPGRPDEGLRMSWLDVTISVEDADLDSFLTIPLSDVFAREIGEAEVLQQMPETFLQSRLGRIEVEVALRAALSLNRGNVQLGVGELSLRVILDDREELAELSVTLEAAEPQIDHSEFDRLGIPPTIIPEVAKIEIVLNRYPIRRFAEMVQERKILGYGSGPGQETLQNGVMMELATAGSSLDVREIRIVAPNFEFSIEGEFQADPKSAFGVTGRMEARIQGIGNVLKWAAGRGEMEMSGFIVLLRGLGRPTQFSAGDDPTYLYELDMASDGSVTLNDIPLDSLLEGFQMLL